MNFYYFCNMKRITRYITIILAAMMLIRCANIVTPSGGPKDEKPPVITESTPSNNSTNFKGKTIHITFDEFITLDNPSNNILISPPMNKKPHYRTNGKTLVIKFQEALKPETTYSIFFGNAIKDLHEGNVFSDFTFNFSTGDKIDSLSLKGKVFSASTLAPAEGFYVGLYSDSNDTLPLDSLPYRVKPNYITTTNKNGNFEFSGLADKEFLIFALKDNNGNQIYDLPNEEIGFYSDLVRPYNAEDQVITYTIEDDSIIKNDNSPSYEIYSFVQEDSIQKIFKKELLEAGLLRFVFRYPAQNVEIKALEELPDTVDLLQVYSTRQDTVLWYCTLNKDSLWVSINDGKNISDTTHYSLKPREAFTKKKKKKTEVKVKNISVKNNLKGNKLKPNEHVILTFSEPVTKLDLSDTIVLIENHDTIYNNLQFEKFDKYGFKYLINKTFHPENKYQILIPDSVFYGVRGFTNEPVRLNFTVSEESEFGNIFLTIEKPANVPQVIVELLDEKDKLIDKQIITETKEVYFEYLEPGKYKLKAILDLDANGIWSPGNFDKKLQPEKIIFYKGTLEVRANWDIDLDEPWKIEN